MAQSAKYKVCSLWHNVFHFDSSMHGNFFLTVSLLRSFSFSFSTYIFCHQQTSCSVIFSDFPNMLCKLEIDSSANKIILLSLQNEANSSIPFITFLLAGLLWMSDGKVA